MCLYTPHPLPLHYSRSQDNLTMLLNRLCRVYNVDVDGRIDYEPQHLTIVSFPSIQNGGTCIDEIDHFRCECSPGFQGPHCSSQSDQCSDAPCRNNGFCVDLLSDYLCICDGGYRGLYITVYRAKPCLWIPYIQCWKLENVQGDKWVLRTETSRA